jgi:hypothetical protein
MIHTHRHRWESTALSTACRGHHAYDEQEKEKKDQQQQSKQIEKAKQHQYTQAPALH